MTMLCDLKSANASGVIVRRAFNACAFAGSIVAQTTSFAPAIGPMEGRSFG